MEGLHWSLGVVDLRSLIAFQRRLVFDPEIPQPLAPDPRDWPALFSFAFGPAKQVEGAWIEGAVVHGSCIETKGLGQSRRSQVLTLQSSNPNLHIRIVPKPAAPISVHAGGPFLEVGCLKGRWFLRDGYHRACALLQAGVFETPAVIVQARSMQELGADEAWFFPENTLFSESPPLVCHFLDDRKIVEYDRPPLLKTLRLTVEEILSPATIKENTDEHCNQAR
jgi:hypothetical protein